MYKLLFIALGGAIGTLSRYFVSGFASRLMEGIFPTGTLTVNLVGSFAMGFLWGLFERSTLSPVVRTSLFIGFLGGFTTFSSFTLESFNLLRDGELTSALAYILVSDIAGIILVFAGYFLARLIIFNFKGVT